MESNRYMDERRPASGGSALRQPEQRTGDGAVYSGPRSARAIPEKRVPVSFRDDRNFRILSIDGGGIKGTFAAALLAELERCGRRPIAELFDLVAGTSTGGILAAGFAAGRAAADLERLYVERGRAIFPPDGLIKRFVRCGPWGIIWARFSRRALVEALADNLGDITIEQAYRRTGLAFCIPASDTKIGEVHVFKSPHHPDYYLDGPRPLADAALASAAAPVYFRPYRTKEGYILTDGGLWANNPILIAVIEANTTFGVPLERISVLSIGYGSAHVPTGWFQHWFGGLWSWKDTVFRSMDLQALNALNQARLLVGPPNVVRVDIRDEQLARIEMDDWVRAHQELPSAGAAAFHDHREAIERMLGLP